MDNIEKKELQHNGSGYPDLTAYEAIMHVEHDEHDKFRKTVGCILRICELAGFTLEERVVLKDKRTGRIWR